MVALKLRIMELARHKIEYAVRAGLLEKPHNCSYCGCEKRLHAHHPDYRKPLDVIWLCSECHMKWHKLLRAINRDCVLNNDVVLQTVNRTIQNNGVIRGISKCWPA